VTRTQILVSALAAFHLVSITTAAIIRDPQDAQPAHRNDQGGGLPTMLTSGLSAIAEGIASANAELWRRSNGLRQITTPYIRTLTLDQRWNMFSRSSQAEEYVRISFGLMPGVPAPDGREAARVVHELVYPTWRADRIRALRAYRDSYRDKAIEQVVFGFVEKNGPQLLRELTQRRRLGFRDAPDLQHRLDALSEDFGALTRYYRAQYGRHFLQPEETIGRTEVWFGVAPIAPPGEPAGLDRQARDRALAAYFDGPVATVRAEQPSLGTEERGAGVIWTLYYVEPSGTQEH
jgi:hypothetical protein